MDETLGYDGYGNYETWFVGIWINNDQATYNALEAIKTKNISAYSKAKQLEELIRELHSLSPDDIASGLVDAALRRVDWLELVSA